MEPNSFILNIVFAWERAVTKTTEKELGMIASHRFPMYKPKENVADLDYITKFFITHKGKYILEMASPGGAGRNKTLGQKEFENSTICLPSYEEQKKIGRYLEVFDHLITLHHHKPSPIANLPDFTYNHHKSCIICVKIKINLHIGTTYDIDMEYFGYLEIAITYNHHKLVYLRYVEIVIITIKEKESMPELE